MTPLSDLALAVVLGLVEGVTEFLPVSSTGHLIVAGDLLGFTGERAATFEIFIQLGAVLAVAWDRRATLVSGRDVPLPRLAILLALAFLPAAVIGLLAHRAIKEHLFSSTVVAWSLLVGAIAIVVIESSRLRPRRERLAAMTLGDAFAVGLAQCLALVPGVSRAAATILGGMMLGLGRPVATEFSFLLAIPTIGAAAVYDLAKSRPALAPGDFGFFATGLVVSFVSALAVVRWLVRYVQRHDFRPFAAWRAALAVLVLAFGVGDGAGEGPPP